MSLEDQVADVVEVLRVGTGEPAGEAYAALAVVLGYLTDLLARGFFKRKDIHSFCEREHCECGEEEGSALHAALMHTLKIALLLIAVNFALNLLLELAGAERLSATLFARPVTGELLLALLGLIPNCSISVIITQAYLSGIIGLGGLFAGLLSNAGIGLLVLFRSNANLRENLTVVAISYVLSALSGILISLLV